MVKSKRSVHLKMIRDIVMSNKKKVRKYYIYFYNIIYNN